MGSEGLARLETLLIEKLVNKKYPGTVPAFCMKWFSGLEGRHTLCRGRRPRCYGPLCLPQAQRADTPWIETAFINHGPPLLSKRKRTAAESFFRGRGAWKLGYEGSPAIKKYSGTVPAFCVMFQELIGLAEGRG